jgi:casein kinase 1
MNYCRRLGFEENPDYAYLKSLFEGLMKDMNYEDDGVYEWTLVRQRIEAQNAKELEEAERIK